MTEEEAHNRLHEVLPRGSQVIVTRSQWSWSTVGSEPLVHGSSGDWHVQVTVPDDVDQVEAAFGSDLEKVVAEMLGRVQQLTRQPRPPGLCAPSIRSPSESRRVL